jgi:abortive infection bacteriophage resistance protein
VTPVESTYSKPFLTVPEQIGRLTNRGMDCGSTQYAWAVLERYGYYRLSGYWHPFRMTPAPPASQIDSAGREIRLSAFEPGTKLHHVVAIYEFDHELRTKIGDILSALEIAFRFYIGHRLGKLDAFAHRKPELLGALQEQTIETHTRLWYFPFVKRKLSVSETRPSRTYQDWLSEYTRHEDRAKDHFVKHFRDNYGSHLPIWVSTEVMGFGVLSTLYGFMKDADKEILAARFQVHAKSGRGDAGALDNWLNNLRLVRNICAHYGRLWNRTFDVVIDAPSQARSEAQKASDDKTDDDHLDDNSTFKHLNRLVEDGVSNKLYGVLTIMRHLFLTIDPESEDVADLVAFIEQSAADIGFDIADLGFPEDWKTDQVWQASYRLPPHPNAVASLLDSTANLTQPGVRELLTKAPVSTPKEPRTNEQAKSALLAARRKLLKAYISYNAVIELELAGVKYFPTFQFRDGAIIDALGDVNKKFLDGHPTVHRSQLQVELLRWWEMPNTGLPKSSVGETQSPRELLYSMPESDFVATLLELSIEPVR